jgi:hypothetical protein
MQYKILPQEWPVFSTRKTFQTQKRRGPREKGAGLVVRIRLEFSGSTKITPGGQNRGEAEQEFQRVDDIFWTWQSLGLVGWG